MHTGVISFCDRIAYNIKSNQTKDVILQELLARFHVNILQKHWHRLDDEGISHLTRSPHFACLRSNGNPYFVYFTKYDGVPIMYFIDKKIQPGYDKPRIILGKGKYTSPIFDGTVIEGEMVKDSFQRWVFLINDVISWKNKLLSEPLPRRLEYAYELLDSHYMKDECMDICQFYVKKFAHATQEGIQALLNLAEELPYTSRGIYFWPFHRSFKPKLYNFDDSLVKQVTRKVKDNPEFREAAEDPENLVSTQQHIEDAPKSTPTEDGERTLWLRKTDQPDVYEIYPASNGMNQGTKIGIANVSSLATSKLLRSVFKDATVAMYIPFVCAWHATFSRWTPLRRAS